MIAAALPAALSVAAVAAAAELNVGAGSSISFGDAAVDFGCSDLIVAGAADAGTATLKGVDNYLLSATGSHLAGDSNLSLSGNFSRSGSFDAGTGSVAITDGCGRTVSNVNGSTTFHDFVVTTTTGKQLVFDAGATTSVNSVLVLGGAPGNLLRIRSSAAGAPSFINAQSFQNIAYVDVADNHATGAIIAPGKPSSYNSIAGSNLYRWFEFGTAIPTLSTALLALLALLLAVAPRIMRRRRQRP